MKLLTALLLVLLSLGTGAFAQVVINTGTADQFAVLGAAGVTNVSPQTHIIGDVGSSPTPTVTGLTQAQVKGTLYVAASPVTAQAQLDLTTAYNEAAAAPCGTDLTGIDLGGLTLAPGVYCFATTAGLTGALKLDAYGDVNAQWIFQIGSALTVAADSTVSIVLNEKRTKDGPKPLWAKGLEGCNVYWQVGSSATIGADSIFRGQMLAFVSITLNGGIFHGKALASTGAISITAQQNVNGPPCNAPEVASN
jgi:ice-binding like protein